MTEPPIAFKTVTLCDKRWVDQLVLAENSPRVFNIGEIYLNCHFKFFDFFVIIMFKN